MASDESLQQIKVITPDFLVDKILSCPRTKLSILRTLMIGSVETGVLLTDFAQQLLQKNADVPGNYLSLRSIEKFLAVRKNYGYKYLHKLPRFVRTLISRKDCSINLKPKDVKNFECLSNFYSKSLPEYRKPKIKIGNRVRISKNDLPFRRDFESHFTQEIFEIVASATRTTFWVFKLTKCNFPVILNSWIEWGS